MISIRKLTMEDSVTTFAYSSDAENVFYMLNSPFLTLEETVKFLAKCIAEYKKEKPKYLSYAVIYEGVHVGEVFASIDGNVADIGWLIDKHYWGKGIATCGASLLVEHLKKELGILHFVAYCDARNIQSKRIMEKIGMQFAGVNGIRNYDKDVSPGEELKYQLCLQ